MVDVNLLVCVSLECIKTGLSCVCVCIKMWANTFTFCLQYNPQCSQCLRSNKHTFSIIWANALCSLFFTIHNKYICNKLIRILKTYMELLAMRLHAPNYVSRHHNYYSITIAYEYIIIAQTQATTTLLSNQYSIFDNSLHFWAPRSFASLFIHCICHFYHFKCIALIYALRLILLTLKNTNTYTHTFTRITRRISRQISFGNYLLHYVLMVFYRKEKWNLK